MKDKIKQVVSSIAPGFFMVGYIIGTGSVTTMVVAGARFGLSLTWALLLSCLFTAFLMIAISRVTIITKRTLLFNLKKHIHPAVGVFMIIALMITSIVSIMGIMGIAASVFQEWTKSLAGNKDGVNQILFSIVLLGILYALYWFGKHDSFLKFLTIMVSIMAVCFIITMIMVIPDFPQMANGLIPQIPKTGDSNIVIAGMVGTTMAGICLVSRSTIVKEKGWTSSDLKKESRDSIFSMVLTFIISVAIIAVAAGTLYVQGIYVNDTVEMMYILEPLVGKFAVSVFAIGILSAAFSSIFPNMVILPWLLNDYKNKDMSLKIPKYRLMVFILALSGLVVPITGGKPIVIMIASQAISPVIMPLLIGSLFYLMNSKKVMGEYKISWILNFGVVITFLFSLFMNFISCQGFFKMFNA